MQAVMSKKVEEPKYSITNKHCHEMEVASDDKLTVTMRKEEPLHYTLEIESLKNLQKILSKTGLNRYESTEFEASGHKWRMILYPEGDKQRNGANHISLSLEILGTEKLSPAWEIHALLNFFVYDHNKDQYISFQDGKVKKFTAVNTELGFSRLVPLSEFNDNSKGYQREDSCKFGVEVFVIKGNGGGECFSTIDEPRKNQFGWKIEKLSGLKERSCYSDEFTIEDFKWKLHLYPKGVSKVKGKYVSIFLCLQDHQKIPSETKVYVEFKIGIIDQNKKKTEKTGNAWFSSSDSAWGFPRLVKLPDQQQPDHEQERKDSHIAYDDVLVEAEISLMSMAKDLYPKTEEKPGNIDTPPLPIPY